MRRLLGGRGGAGRHAADDVLVEKVAGGPPFAERQRFEVAAFSVKLAHQRAHYLVGAPKRHSAADQVIRNIRCQEQA